MSANRKIPPGSGNVITGFLLSPWVFHILRLFIGGLFLYTGATKLADIAGFGKAIAAYGILPAGLVSCAAVGLPALEVGAGFGTLLNRRWGILASLAMLVLFTGVLGYGVAIGLEIDCGCFPTGKTVQAAQEKPADILQIPSDSSSLSQSSVIGIEPVQALNKDKGKCSEEEIGSSSLKSALVRDLFLMMAVIYLVAWPDWRKKQLGTEIRDS